MDYSPSFWLGMFNTVWTASLTIYSINSANRKDEQKRMEELRKDLNGFGERLTRAETNLAAMPTYEFLARVHGEMHDKMNTISNQLCELTGKLNENKEIREQDRVLLHAIHKKIMNP